MSVSELEPKLTAESARSTPRRGAPLRGRFVLIARILRVRLRFILVFLVAFLVVGKWQVLRTYWEKLTRPQASSDTTGNVVSVDTEYFCPMDPGVVSNWSGKCGICNMTLVRRKKGDMVQLPEGVVARMQLSPYRVQLAGIQTSLTTNLPLVREIVTIGRVRETERTQSREGARSATVVAEIFERDMPFVTAARQVEVIPDALLAPPCVARVSPIDLDLEAHAGIIPLQIELDNVPWGLRQGSAVTVRIHVPVADIEPFRSMPRTAPPITPDSLRVVFVCPDHSDVLKTKQGNCPIGKNELERRSLGDNQRVDWWCPMHPKVTADSPGAECRECNGMKLLPRVVTFTPVGEVLSVPETAVVDTGTRKVVYVERAPGMFEGVEVTLGPRCGNAFPVIKGLEVGQRVATTGSFLIDAETRLNPSVAVGYFGAAAEKAR